MTSQFDSLAKMFKEGFDDIKDSQSKVSSRMERLEQRTNDLKSQMGQIRDVPNPTPSAKMCHYCKSPDHLVADCPRLAEKEQREKEKAAGSSSNLT